VARGSFWKRFASQEKAGWLTVGVVRPSAATATHLVKNLIKVSLAKSEQARKQARRKRVRIDPRYVFVCSSARPNQFRVGGSAPNKFSARF